MSGTPKTLSEAIRNGIEATHSPDWRPEFQNSSLELIEAHVRDFLAQKFGAALMASSDPHASEGQIAKLYEMITGKKVV